MKVAAYDFLIHWGHVIPSEAASQNKALICGCRYYQKCFTLQCAVNWVLVIHSCRILFLCKHMFRTKAGFTNQRHTVKVNCRHRRFLKCRDTRKLYISLDTQALIMFKYKMHRVSAWKIFVFCHKHDWNISNEVIENSWVLAICHQVVSHNHLAAILTILCGSLTKYILKANQWYLVCTHLWYEISLCWLCIHLQMEQTPKLCPVWLNRTDGSYSQHTWETTGRPTSWGCH